MEIPPSPLTGPSGDASPARVGERPGFGSRSAWWRLRHEAWPLAAMAVVWLASSVVAGVGGEFPLNDDWIYATPALTWAATGQPVFPMRASPMLVQAAWGAAFARTFGATYAALRLSTLALGLVGVWATYWLARQAGARRSTATIGALTLAANPVYVALSHTFMTDVPFTAVATLAFVVLAGTAAPGTTGRLLVGGGLAGASTLIRTQGLLLGTIYLVWRLSLRRRTWREVVLGSLPLACSLAAWLVGRQVIAAGGSPIDAAAAFAATGYQYPLDQMLQRLPWSVIDAAGALPWRLFCSMVYLGAFLVPITWVSVSSDRGPFARWPRMVTAVSIAVCVVAVGLGWRMPLGGNILIDSGIGPLTVRDTYLLALPHWPRAPHLAWWLLTVAGIASGSVVIWRAVLRSAAARSSGIRQGPPANARAIASMAAVLAACYVLAAAVIEFRDRHLLAALPLLTAVLLSPSWAGTKPMPDRRVFRAVVSQGPPVLALAAMLAFSVAGTHDYLAWNAARWTALGTLERSGITSRQIDGGLEYNALRGYDPRFVPVRGKSWWWVSDDEFVVGLGPLPGYDIVRRLPFARWMPPGQGDVVTLRRHSVAASGGPVTRDRPEWSNQWP